MRRRASRPLRGSANHRFRPRGPPRTIPVGLVPSVTERRYRLLGLLASLGLLAATSASAKDYYVATTGSDSNAGTIDQPLATLQKAVNAVVAGDTVYIRGGTFRITTPASSAAGIVISKSGTSDTNRIRFWAYPGERVQGLRPWSGSRDRRPPWGAASEVR